MLMEAPMLTTSLIWAGSAATHSTERNTAARSSGTGFDSMLSAELDNVGTLPAPAGGKAGGMAPPKTLDVAAKISELTQMLFTLATASPSGSSDSPNEPAPGNADLGNNSESNVEDYWTPERLRTALPMMPNPTVDPRSGSDPSPPANKGRQIGDVGGPPPGAVQTM
jgi:hypothetical protein